MKTPDYVLMEDYNTGDYSSEKILPAGSFVRPIDYYYLPAHIKESASKSYLEDTSKVFCYTYYGIKLIEWSKIRKLGYV